MKLKLDENLGARAAQRLRAASHDVSTAHEQAMGSASDRQVIATCRSERRCLVSLDLDFANPLLFKPSEYSGIAVLRLGSKPSAEGLITVVDTLIGELESSSISGELWIVERRRIRKYQPKDDTAI